MNTEFDNIIERICVHDPRYKEDSYAFVMDALSFTQKKFRRQRHVSGSELLIGVKELLLQRYGPMALTVLKHWGIERTEDFGHIVFNLVENKVLSKSEDDDIESFSNGYDFIEVFDHGYHRDLAKKISRMRPY